MKKIVIVHRLKTNKGFILAEILLAICIISVALTAIFGMFTQAIQADLRAKDYTVAANLAQKQLELLKTHPPGYWADLTLPAVIAWSDQGQPPNSRYTVLTNAVATNHDSLAQVTVTVSWEGRGSEQTIQFLTLYRGL